MYLFESINQFKFSNLTVDAAVHLMGLTPLINQFKQVIKIILNMLSTKLNQVSIH